jgi:hypothetical protein
MMHMKADDKHLFANSTGESQNNLVGIGTTFTSMKFSF